MPCKKLSNYSNLHSLRSNKMSNHVNLKLISTLTFFLFLTHSHLVFSDDSILIPADDSQVNIWFESSVKPLEARKGQLDQVIEEAEANPTFIKVRQDGTGDFNTITNAINSIPEGNMKRVVVLVGPGKYAEKVKIVRTKPFVTLYGTDPNNPPVLTYAGTAAVYGTVDSATFIVDSDYFSAVNIIMANTAPRPVGVKPGEQAVAFRIGGDKSSIYNCKFLGFQDTLCDYHGKHFFKDCYIEGTVDFVFGAAKSIFLNTELHVISGDNTAVIAAHSRTKPTEETGMIFVHCNVTGTGGMADLGRAWFSYSRVIYAYSTISDVIRPVGWWDKDNAAADSTIYFGEYNCKGPGSDMSGRASYTKKLSDEEVKPFISLAFIEGSTWLLPPFKP